MGSVIGVGNVTYVAVKIDNTLDRFSNDNNEVVNLKFMIPAKVTVKSVDKTISFGNE
jgi:hypothetical protein